MKQTLYKLFLTTTLVLTALSSFSCVKEDMDDCFPDGGGNDIDQEGKFILSFECINENYKFPEIVEDLELLFYGGDGSLTYDLTFTGMELTGMNWWVPLSERWGQKEGTYKIIALVNYKYETHITVSDKQTLEKLQTKIDRDAQNQINYELKDTYYGIADVSIEYNHSKEDEHTIYLSKNTNTIKLTVEFDDPETLPNLSSYRSFLAANNGHYYWDNTIYGPSTEATGGQATLAEEETVYYKPYESSFGDDRPIIEDWIKTMRIWTAADMILNMEFVEGTQSYNETLNIPAVLAKVEKDGVKIYDTDEKLEHHDYFEVTVRIGSEFVIVSIMINGWFLVLNDEDI